MLNDIKALIGQEIWLIDMESGKSLYGVLRGQEPNNNDFFGLARIDSDQTRAVFDIHDVFKIEDNQVFALFYS